MQEKRLLRLLINEEIAAGVQQQKVQKVFHFLVRTHVDGWREKKNALKLREISSHVLFSFSFAPSRGRSVVERYASHVTVCVRLLVCVSFLLRAFKKKTSCEHFYLFLLVMLSIVILCE